MFISYAQNYEDVMLWRALQDVEKGFYIDVGACDPVVDSVTKAFYDAGWRGINIEPVEFWHMKNQQDRPEDINLQLAMGARQTDADFFELVGSGLSTMDEVFARRAGTEHGFEIRHYPVPVETLAAVCEQYDPAEIHFLKIDVEGAETFVLRGADFIKNRPWIILVEATVPGSQVENYREWEPCLVEHQYHFVYFDGLNRFYIADEHKELDGAFEQPPHYFDFFKRANEYFLEGRERNLQKELAAVRKQLEDVTDERAKIQAFADRLTEEKQDALGKIADGQSYIRELEEKLVKIGVDFDHAVREQVAAKISVQQLLVEKKDIFSKLENEKLHAEWPQNEWNRAKEQIGSLQHEVTLLQTQLRLEQQQAALNKKAGVDVQQRFEQMQKIYHVDHAAMDHLQMNLQAVYASWSWRITWPLRKISQPLFELFPFLKRPVQSLLVQAMDFVLAREQLSARLLKIIDRYPACKEYLLQVAQTNRLQADTVPVAGTVREIMDVPRQTVAEQPEYVEIIPEISSRAARIYRELQKARQDREV